jgi:predicted Fe-S protein YdhL (DUF1289 family)
LAADFADPEERRRRRIERREARRRSWDTTIPSPCIAVCTVDRDSNQCIGCRRTVDEIRDWMIMTAQEKLRVLAAIEARKAADCQTEPGGDRSGQ